MEAWLQAMDEESASEDSLDAIIAKYVTLIESNGISQHTEAWIKIREFLTGGSTAAIFAGGSIGPISEFMQSKMGLVKTRNRGKYNSCTYMEWGNICEPLIEKYVEADLHCIVHGTNIFIKGHEQNGILYTAYSPDGIAAIHDKITLLEFKCPFARMPGAKVPAQYVPQVKMGLDIIPIAETGLFVDAVFRKCAQGDLDFGTKYDASMGQEIPSGAAVLAIGVVYFAVDTIERAKKVAALRIARKFIEANALMMDTDPMYDLGTCTPAIFEKFMAGYSAGFIHPIYSPVFTGHTIDLAATKTEFASYCKANIYEQGFVLSWKLFQVRYVTVDKQPGYMAPLMPKIIIAMNTLREAAGLPETDRRNIYKKWAGVEIPHIIDRVADDLVIIE